MPPVHHPSLSRQHLRQSPFQVSPNQGQILQSQGHAPRHPLCRKVPEFLQIPLRSHQNPVSPGRKGQLPAPEPRSPPLVADPAGKRVPIRSVDLGVSLRSVESDPQGGASESGLLADRSAGSTLEKMWVGTLTSDGKWFEGLRGWVAAPEQGNGCLSAAPAYPEGSTVGSVEGP